MLFVVELGRVVHIEGEVGVDIVGKVGVHIEGVVGEEVVEQ